MSERKIVSQMHVEEFPDPRKKTFLKLLYKT